MKKRLLLALVFIFLTWGVFSTVAESTDAPRITKDELKAMLENPDLVIIDVRYGKDWTGSDIKIKGAIREDPGKIESWANKYPKDRVIVLYCA